VGKATSSSASAQSSGCFDRLLRTRRAFTVTQDARMGYPAPHNHRAPGNVGLYGSPEISGQECVFISGHGSIAGTTYRADEAAAQATAQSERTRPLLVANRFHAISQASMMSARLRNTELASQWLRR